MLPGMVTKLRGQGVGFPLPELEPMGSLAEELGRNGACRLNWNLCVGCTINGVLKPSAYTETNRKLPMLRITQADVLLPTIVLGAMLLNSCISADSIQQLAVSVENPVQSNPAEDFGCPLVWSDEFETEGLPDPTKWRYNVGAGIWGNQESQYYTASRTENARVQDGRLVIEARQEPWKGRRYTSARLVSMQEWTYGRFEASAKLPSGRGTWPAIWMLPDLPKYGGWPLGGEIDIMEHVGHDADRIHSTVHTQAFNHRLGTHKGASIIVPTARSDFNLYAVEWTPTQIKGFVNDTHYFTFANERLQNPDADERQWPFDHPFHLILNIAVGGSWGGQQGIDPDIWPQRLEVDFVRVYSCEE